MFIKMPEFQENSSSQKKTLVYAPGYYILRRALHFKVNILYQRKYYIRQKVLFLLKKVLRFYRKSYFFKKKYYNKTESRIYLVQKVTIFSLFALLFFQKGKILTKNVF